MLRFRDGVLTWQQGPPRVEAHQSGNPSWAAAYRWRNDDGDESSTGATFIDAADTPITVGPSGDVALDTPVRIRVLIDEQNTGGGGDYNHTLQESLNGSAFTNLTNNVTFAQAIRSVASAHVTDGNATTDHGLTATSGAFTAGQIRANSTSSTTARTIAQDDYTIHEWVVEFVESKLSDGDEITLRIGTFGDDSDTVPLTGTPATVATGGGTVEFSGAIAATSAVASASLALLVGLSGAISGASSVDASLSRDVPLSGAIAADSTITGTLGNNVALSGSVDGASGLSGTIGNQVALAGSVGAASGIQGNIARTSGLSGAAAAESTLQGTLSAARPLAGTVAADSALTGTATRSAGLAGGIASTASLSGALSTGGLVTLTGSIPADTALTGSLSRETALAGSIGGQSTVAGVLGRSRPLTGLVAGASGLAGSVRANRPLSGATSGQSALAGSLTVEGVSQVALSGQIVAASAVSGGVVTERGLAGSVDAGGALAGDLTVTGVSVVTLSGTLGAASTLTGSLLAARGLEGTVTGAGVLAGTLDISAPTVSVVSGGRVIVTDGPARVRLLDRASTARLADSPSRVRLSDRATRAILAVSPALARVEGDMPFTLLVGETARPLRVRLIDGDGSTPTLTGAAVTFSMSAVDSSAAVVSGASADILSATPPSDPDDPNVKYEFAPADVAAAGNYRGEFRVAFSGGTVGYYPSKAPIDITIRRNLSGS